MKIEVEGKQIEISDEDFWFIAERCNTSPSGSVSFTASAVKRYRRVTNQEYADPTTIKLQMLSRFGSFA